MEVAAFGFLWSPKRSCRTSTPSSQLRCLCGQPRRSGEGRRHKQQLRKHESRASIGCREQKVTAQHRAARGERGTKGRRGFRRSRGSQQPSLLFARAVLQIKAELLGFHSLVPLG